MKTLSIQQPWADLIVRGIKDVENRPKPTSYRGPLLIHAGLKMRMRPGVAHFWGPRHEFERGGIVGTADLVDCIENSTSVWAQKGSFHLVLANVRRVPFFPSKGMLGLYDTPWPPTEQPAEVPQFTRDERDVPPEQRRMLEAQPGEALRSVLATLSDAQVLVLAKALELEATNATDARERIQRDFARRWYSVLGNMELGALNTVLESRGLARAKTQKRGWQAFHDNILVSDEDCAEDEEDEIESELVLECRIKRDDDWLYFIDDDCDVRRARPRRGTELEIDEGTAELVLKTDVSREEGFLYFLDYDGNVRRCLADDDEEEDEDSAEHDDEASEDDDEEADILAAEESGEEDEVPEGEGSQVVAKAGVEREPGWLYYLDKRGNISRARMVKGGTRTTGKPEVVAKTGVERAEGYLYFIDVNGDVSRTPMRRRAEVSSAPRKIADIPTEDVMAAFRTAARGAGSMEREDLIRAVSRELGFERAGPVIQETLAGHLRAAIRRGIIASEGQQVRAGTSSMADYALEDLRETLLSVMRKGKRYERDEVVRAVAAHLGFQRVTENVREPLKSAMNSAIRQGLLEYEGQSEIWRAT